MKNQYGIFENINNIISYILTKFFYPKARLIRYPVYIRGKKNFSYGKGLTTGYNCRIEVFLFEKTDIKKLIIGNNCKIGDYVHIAAGESIEIGNDCLLASKIYISDISHGDYSSSINASSPLTPPDERKLFTNPVRIGNKVWIGENVSILPGVSVGDGCIIGANSVVTKNIPSNTISVGSPAVPIKQYNFDNKTWDKII